MSRLPYALPRFKEQMRGVGLITRSGTRSPSSAKLGHETFDRIGSAYQGNNREIRRSGRAHHYIYVEKTFYLSYFESNSLRNKTGNYLCRCREFDPLIKESLRLIVKHLRLALRASSKRRAAADSRGPLAPLGH